MLTWTNASKLRRSASAIALGASLSLLTTAAFADDGFIVDEEEPQERPVVVVQKPSSAPTAPPDGASEAEIFAYLRALKKDIRDTQTDLSDAKRDDDDAEVARLKEELKERKIILKEEQDRLTTIDAGLVAGGGVLTGLGSLSLLSSVVLLVVWPMTGIDGDVNDEYGWASLACLGGGAVGLGAGIPMIVAGKRREIRYDEYEEARTTIPVPSLGPTAGVHMTLSF